MCKRPYTVSWEKGAYGKCPHFIFPNGTKVRATHASGNEGEHVYYDYESLATMWSDWNKEYVDADFPRLLIRFEDTLFHLEKVIQIVKDCVGIKKRQPVKYLIDSTKTWRDATNFVSAMEKYGKLEGRHQDLTYRDRKYLEKALDPKLMEMFHYPQMDNVNQQSPHSWKGRTTAFDLRIKEASKDMREKKMSFLDISDLDIQSLPDASG
jgi:hypothetical protein